MNGGVRMWIYGYKIKRNVRLAYFESKYIQEKIEEMVKKLSDKHILYFKKIKREKN